MVTVLDQPGLPDDAPARLLLVAALAQVPDPRAARGVRHGVLSVLLISACAVLAGARSYAAIAEYAHDSRRDVLDALQIGPVAPHSSTICRVLQQLDPDALDAALRSWTLARLAAQAPNPPPRRPSRESRIAAGLRHHAREHRRPLATYAIT